uniref:Uncharacterized protein n=1 Tax=Arundo donax TaxID=35708 RepID=A0A0A9H5T1_ARUDO
MMPLVMFHMITSIAIHVLSHYCSLQNQQIQTSIDAQLFLDMFQNGCKICSQQVFMHLDPDP